MSKDLSSPASSAGKDEAQLNEEALAQWKLPLEDVYRYSLSFLKDKEGTKALRLSYAEKVQLVALEKQVTHGPYRPDLTPDCGFFDVVGNDRKNAWSELGTISRSAAMFEHVKLVHSRCPLLSAYIEAQKVNREHDRATTDETQQPQPTQSFSPALDPAPQTSTVTVGTNDLDAKAKLETLSDDLEKLKLEEEQLRVQQEAQIRTLLNQQTAIQFRQYAQEQHPNDTKKQDELVRQLQQQHFQQYMTQVLKQQIEHQKQQARQIAALLRQQRKQQTEPTVSTSEQLADGAAAGAGGLVIVDESNEEAAGSSRGAPPNGSHALSPLGASATVVPAAELTLPTGTDDVESNVDDAGADTELSDESYDDNEAGISSGGHTARNAHLRSAHRSTSVASATSSSNVLKTRVKVIANASSKTNGTSSRTPRSTPKHQSPVSNVTSRRFDMAKLWTRKDLNEFKRQLKADRSAYFEIASGESRTVRVPTHPEGSCIFWEFATDNYDIGFGVYFEWNLDPGDKITVNISESDDEDLEDEDAPPNPEGKDPERGKKKKENEQPTDEIIPVYRRDSHEEVYCGSHTYPGKGVYLLKFDNSYSLWRSKWVYYRVYYGK